MTDLPDKPMPDGVMVARIDPPGSGPPCDCHRSRNVLRPFSGKPTSDHPAATIRVTVKGATLTRLFLCPAGAQDLSRKLREIV